MNIHKRCIKYLNENIAITEKFHKELLAERALMASDTWNIDFIIKDVERRQNDLLEALSEAIHCLADDDPKTLLNNPT